jgi:hypothetical protein
MQSSWLALKMQPAGTRNVGLDGGRRALIEAEGEGVVDGKFAR